MTDDLDAMGVERSSEGREHKIAFSPVAEKYEEILRGLIDGRLGDATTALWNLEPISIPDAHSAVLRVAPDTNHRIYCAGNFLNAAYCLAPEKVITYDLPFPISRLGRKFPQHKLLVNDGVVGDWFGVNSEGILVNSGVVNTHSVLCYGWFIDRRPKDFVRSSFPWARNHINGLYLETQRRTLCSGRVPESYPFSGLAYLLNVPLAVGDEPNATLETYSRGWGRQISCTDNVTVRLQEWFAKIECWASNNPEMLLHRYGTGTEPPHDVAQRELFDIIFERGQQ